SQSGECRENPVSARDEIALVHKTNGAIVAEDRPTLSGVALVTERYHTMVMVAACLGLRASEIMGLQWQDFNWEDLTVLIRRGVVNGRSGDTKTEASQKSLPIDLRLARSLRELWKRTLHQGPQDWVFANKGGRPRAQQN